MGSAPFDAAPIETETPETRTPFPEIPEGRDSGAHAANIGLALTRAAST
jgi:hypothetical protein